MLKTNYVKEPLLLVPPRNCLSVLCLNITTEETAGWIEVTNYICYILFPVILALSLLGQLINIIVLTKQIRLSIDTYFFVLSITTFVHVTTSVIITLQHYVDKMLADVLYYSILSHEWTLYIIVWIILSVALERTLTVTLYQTYNQVSPTQSWVISGLVIGVGFISTIPRLWQYDMINYYNQTSSGDYKPIQDSYQPSIIDRYHKAIEKTGDHKEYDVVYFWYITCIFIGLPFILMILTVIGLCTSVSTSRPIESKYRTDTALILNRRLKEEMRLTHLIIKLMSLFIVMMFPLILMHCLYFINVFDMNDAVCITVTNVLSLWYHIFFIIQQQIYFCYNKQYRLTFISLCCCFC